MHVDRVPGEFRYWEHLAHPRVQRLRAASRRVLGFDPAPPDAVARMLAAMYYDADPTCEAFVADAYDARGSRAGRALLERALAEGVAAIPDAPASLRALFADLEVDPPWLDRELVERGARAFRRYGTDVFRFAGAITLEGYNENSVAKPLALTGAYAGGSTRRRFLETAAFWIAVSEPGGLRAGAPGRASALRVRVMHVFVRRKLLAHPQWDLAAWGVPISQGDALLTLMGGSFAPGLALHALGYHASRADILAMMHFWRYVGHLMGVRPRWYPTTLREAAQLSFVTFVKGVHGSGDDGHTLCRSYARAFAPEGTRDLRGAIEDGVHRAFTRLFVSPRSHRAHALPGAGLWPALLLAQAPARAALEVARRVVPAIDDAVDRRARAERAAWFARHMQGRSAAYEPAEHFVR